MVLVALGALSVLVTIGLALFALYGYQHQLEARARIVMLEQALQNHNDADAFMDDIRADVLRAVLRSVGFNKEADETIRVELIHHIDVVTKAIAENASLSLDPDLHRRYVKIADLISVYVKSGSAAVELALSDAAAGAANFEHFRSHFSELEGLMDSARDVLRHDVGEVRKAATEAATLSKQLILGSCIVGVLLLMLITTIAVLIAQRITAALASSREEAHHLALHDTLTELPNRAYLAQRLERALAEGQRGETMLAVLFLDLDRFKQVNDTLGHPSGDLLLRIVADRLRACVRKSDTVARLGGDEFAIIQTPLARVEDAAALAELVVKKISEPYDLNGHQVLAGTSIGIARVPADANDPTLLLKMADQALYRAKQEGRGTFRMFEPGMDSDLQARRVLELDLRHAVTRQQLELHYQPLVDMASGEITSLEALVRWRHPERGLIPPNDFIPLAEETGLIVPIGAWVLERACADAARWPMDRPVAVNISAAQFKGGGLVAAVEHALVSAAFPPTRLELEVTETALIADAQSTLEILRELRAMGIRIAMDDFGTGYSSLGYLRSFPFDKIKIDRLFVKDLETDSDCKGIVRAVVGLGKNLRILTTAEGVETFAQLEQLRAEGCDQAQGYFFSRPVPAAEVAGLLNRWLPDVQVRHGAPVLRINRGVGRWVSGIDFADASEIFAGRTATVEDRRKVYPEPRFNTAGFLAGRMVVTVWTPTPLGRRVISMRHCHEDEARLWRQSLVRPGRCAETDQGVFRARGNPRGGKGAATRARRPRPERPQGNPAARSRRRGNSSCDRKRLGARGNSALRAAFAKTRAERRRDGVSTGVGHAPERFPIKQDWSLSSPRKRL